MEKLQKLVRWRNREMGSEQDLPSISLKTPDFHLFSRSHWGAWQGAW